MIALLDTCVLFPRVLRDTLLDVAQAGMYDPRWSDRILEELRRNLITHRGMDEDAAARLVVAMHEVFPEAAVDDYNVLIPAMTNHPKDRHVLAAAVRADADLIVTSNLVDFPTTALVPFGITAASPDDFLRLMYAQAPDDIVQVVMRQAAGYGRSPMTVAQLVERLSNFAPDFAKELGTRLLEEVR
ncbi:MAG: PIN domain-containing protein [Thermomicrobiales bacterium]